MKPLLIALAFVAACSLEEPPQGTDSGNPTRLVVSGIEDGLRSSHGTIDEAWIGLSRVRLDRCDEGDAEGDDHVDFDGPFAINLLDTTDLGSVTLDADVTICGVRLDLHHDSDGEPILGDQSITLQGQTAAGTTYAIWSDENDEFRVDSDEPLSIDDAEEPALKLRFALDFWVLGVDLDAAELVDGEALVDDDNNSDLLDVFEDNVKLSADLLRDE